MKKWIMQNIGLKTHTAEQSNFCTLQKTWNLDLFYCIKIHDEAPSIQCKICQKNWNTAKVEMDWQFWSERVAYFV